MHRSLHNPGVGVGYLVDPAPGRHTSTDAGIVENPTMRRFLTAQGRKPAGRHYMIAKGAEMAVTMAALQTRTPVAGSLPFSAAATVPTANSAAKPTGSAYGAGSPGRRAGSRAA